MIGYWLLQALENALPGRPVTSLVTQTLVAADDPAFGAPTKFVGPVYGEDEARRLAQLWGWEIRRDGKSWRRVVASPDPQAIVEMAQVRTLASDGAIVVCAGGGGIPVVRGPEGELRGVEAVVDKDLTAALLARQLDANVLLLLTDVPAVEIGYGSAAARPVGRTTASALRREEFSPGSMGPKVEAACRFVEATGRVAMIGRMFDASDLLEETKGTVVRAGAGGPTDSKRGEGS